MIDGIHDQLHGRYLAAHAFLRTTAGAGTLLFIAAALAIIAANSPLAGAYEAVLHAKVGVTIGPAQLYKSFGHWVSHGLMAIFFLLVGLEIKRELLSGELSSPSVAALPAMAAVGGLAAPALIFFGFNHADATAMRGWAIPAATDIAFSLSVLALLGARVPLSLKVFLTAVAVLDDLLAIAIIAVFYSDNLQPTMIGYAAIVSGAMVALNRFRVANLTLYLLAGALLWLLMLKSGLHATLAGVITAFCVPHGKQGEHGASADTALMRLEHRLHKPVTYLIMPLFAFANAGVGLAALSATTVLRESLPAGIVLGLLLGKPLGICGAVWLAVRLNIARLPRDCDWGMVLGVACLCGIGFTVSLFIADLAFAEQAPAVLNRAKAGVLTGSTLAGLAGFLLIRSRLSARANRQAC